MKNGEDGTAYAGLSDWLTISLEEYRQVWEENRMGMGNSVKMLAIGIPLVVSLFSIAFGGFVDLTPESSVLLLRWVMPFGLYFICILWLMEIGRMVRAGNFLNILEQRFGLIYTHPKASNLSILSSEVHLDLLSKPAIWHKWLRSKHPMRKSIPQGKLKFGYLAMAGFWLISALFSMWQAQSELLPSGVEEWAPIIVFVIACTLIGFKIKDLSELN